MASSHTNHWWRAHHGISNDAKLQFLALSTGTKRCEVGWVWVILVDFASQNQPLRGSVAGLDNGEIALMADLDINTVTKIVDAMKKRGMIQEDGFLSSWAKRQPQRERDSGDSTAAERQRRRRAKLRGDSDVKTDVDVTAMSRHVTVMSRDVTVRHGDVTADAPQDVENPDTSNMPVTPCHAQRRGEESRVYNTYANISDATSEVLNTPVETPPKTKDRKNRKRTTGEIRKDLGERLPWWEAFWGVFKQICPYGMNAGMDAYERRVTDKAEAVLIWKAAKKYVAHIAEKRKSEPGAPAKYAQGWLNGERYLDEYPDAPGNEPTPAAPPPKPVKVAQYDGLELYKKKIEDREKCN